MKYKECDTHIRLENLSLPDYWNHQAWNDMLIGILARCIYLFDSFFCYLGTSMGSEKCISCDNEFLYLFAVATRGDWFGELYPIVNIGQIHFLCIPVI